MGDNIQCFLSFFGHSPAKIDVNGDLDWLSSIPNLLFRLNGAKATSSLADVISQILNSAKRPIFVVEVTGKLDGGKGGFGSMLRAQGGRMSKRKASSYDSCRNIDGVRIGSKRQAVELAKFIQEEPHREREREAEIEKAIETALNPSEKKYYAKGIPDYVKTQETIAEVLEQAFADKFSSSDSSEGDSDLEHGDFAKTMPKEQSAVISRHN
ncbi:hypothetical protein MDAP_002776 [Mitosporidium daphniae]|uniref:SDE2-like domain-containing protein n=1 Tax=Mitosporidium daphniae TaxID=1485682 RepID=A0A098VSV1_9MICR|nr:uncharacterized protein DI09_1p230 [Mitosporidium daphniae]KGG52173.1 hypothetical protein DI09_1p230 [Mitosporidium daphniae]|eukprot:XP_013238600.1 uncharacterized protein DI09_1p230 [Mitosporidium daphniae]